MTADNYTDQMDSLSSERLVQWTGVSVAFIYILSLVIGIPANLYVLFRMMKLARSDNERYRNGSGIALCSMAMADLCALLLIFGQNIQQAYTNEEDFNTQSMHLICKLSLFFTHTVTSISIWSWLLLSSLRYLAICHPLYHLRLWQMPYKALAIIIGTSAFLNSWLLVAVQSTEYGCAQYSLMQNTLMANTLFHLVESFWSFVVPLVVIVYMDTIVLLKSTSFPKWRMYKARRKSALEEIIRLTRTTSIAIKPRHNHHRALYKWLGIAFACILLNTPENLYRMFMLFSFEYVENAIQYSLRMFAQALYFSQFAFNALFLAVFVYDKSTRSKAEMHGGQCEQRGIRDKQEQPALYVPLTVRSRLPSASEFDSPGKGTFIRMSQMDKYSDSVNV